MVLMNLIKGNINNYQRIDNENTHDKKDTSKS